MKKLFLFSIFFILLSLGCRGEKTVDKAIEKIDLPKVQKGVPAAPEIIKKNVETTVEVLREKPKPIRKLRIFNPTPTPTGRIWPVINIIQKNEPRRIVYETTENTISVAEKAIGNIFDIAFNPTPTPIPPPEPEMSGGDALISSLEREGVSFKRAGLFSLDDYWLEELAKEKVMGDVDGLSLIHI